MIYAEFIQSVNQLKKSNPLWFELEMDPLGTLSDSDWNIVEQNRMLNLWQTQGFLALSDNHAGDYYGYSIQNGTLSDIIYEYEHESHQITPTQYRNLYEFFMEVGLKQITS